MKKTVKIIALCLSILALTALFAGCDALDEMKANHAILSKDMEALRFRGETYKKLPGTENLYTSSTYGITYDNIAVTEYDVPVLLSSAFSFSSDYDSARDVFSVYPWQPYGEGLYESYFSSSDDIVFYCNEKDYDTYVNAIKNNTYDYIGVEYEIHDNEGWYYSLDALSEDLSELLLDYVKNPDKMSEEVFNDISHTLSYYESQITGIYRCDKDAKLCQYIDSFTILKDSAGNRYFVDHINERAVKLSDEYASEIKDEYFSGYYAEDVNEEASVEFIGFGEETELIVD